MQAGRYSLVADIGGTNARFALVADGDKTAIQPCNLAVADYPGIVDAIRAYLKLAGLSQPYQAAISVASPVTGDQLNMTNHTWSFSVRDTRAALGLHRLKVLNDYTALALALPVLTDNECRQIGDGEPLAGFPMAVIGPGTGLGVSAAVHAGKHWIPLEGEGGHVSYGPVNAREQQIIERLREKQEHVSAELLASGPGLARLYEMLCLLEHGAAIKLRPGEVSDLALAGEDDIATEALQIFCGIVGTVAGNLALTLGARGGIYIGGGIVPRVIEFFAASSFRERFERHGRLTDYLRRIPTCVIDTAYPAFTGAVIALDPVYENIGVVSHEARLSY